MSQLKALISKSSEFVIKTNFTFAVMILIGAAVSTLIGDSGPFEDNSNLYGPLANNLRLMLFYMAAAEINIVWYCWYRQRQTIIVWVGFFYILTIGGLEFYSNVNRIPVDPYYDAFFFYQGLSHIVYGFYYMLKTGVLDHRELRF